MRKLVLVLVAAVVLGIPSVTYAQSCAFDGLCACDYINNGFSSTTGWTYSGVTFPYIADPCLSGAPQNRVAQFGSNGSLSRTFTTYVTGGASYELYFYLYLPTDYDDWYDVITVKVKNETTNQTETFYFRGSDYDTSCPGHTISLSNDYSGAQVKVTFTRGYLGTGVMQIDNVSFWEVFC